MTLALALGVVSSSIAAVAIGATLEKRTAASADDAEERADGSMSLSSSDLEMVQDSDTQKIGMRWTGITIPKNATIVTAYIQFSAKESQSETTVLTLRGQAAGSAAAFSSSSNDISNRSLTSSSVSWTPAAWSSGQAGSAQRTPELKALIQQIVNGTSWASGNALAIVVTGSGHRTAYAYNGNAAAAPLLHIEYSGGSTSEPPPPPSGTVTTVERRTVTSSDDAEQSSSGSVGLSSSDLELTYDSGTQTVGMRWTGLGIPRGATIRAAYIQFAARESHSEATSLVLRGQAADNAATFSSTSGGISSRPRTSASVGWTPSSWSSGSAGSSQRTPELKTLIQEVVNRSGWGTSSALAIIVTGTGHRTAWSYDGSSSQAPLLHVEYEGGSGGSTPPSSSPIAVYAGYYDTHHSSNPRTKPSPWRGSSGVTFVGTQDPGTTNDWDTSAIRIDNLTSSTISGVSVTVDMGSRHFALWSANSIPAGGKLILAQTGLENFDGSDTSPAGCIGCSPTLCVTQVSSAVPVVHVTYGGKTVNYYDPGQILNTHGVDAAGCPYTGTRNDESEAWQQIFPSGSAASAEVATAEGEWPALDAAPERTFSLGAPFPNPNHGELNFSFRVGRRGMVRLAVYDISGRLVKTLVEDVLEPGEYRGRANLGAAESGVYFCDMRSDEGEARERFTLVR